MRRESHSLLFILLDTDKAREDDRTSFNIRMTFIQLGSVCPETRIFLSEHSSLSNSSVDIQTVECHIDN